MTAPDPLAWGAVVAYCGWDPSAQVTGVTVDLDGNGTRLLTLPSLYVTDVASVVVKQSDGADPYTATIGYGLDVDWSENGVLTWSGWTCGWSGVWPVGSRNVTVTYSSGYSEVPDDLAAAANNIAGRLGGMGAVSTRLGSAGINYGQAIADGGLLGIEQMVLDRYRIPRVA